MGLLGHYRRTAAQSERKVDWKSILQSVSNLKRYVNELDNAKHTAFGFPKALAEMLKIAADVAGHYDKSAAKLVRDAAGKIEDYYKQIPR